MPTGSPCKLLPIPYICSCRSHGRDLAFGKEENLDVKGMYIIENGNKHQYEINSGFDSPLVHEGKVSIELYNGMGVLIHTDEGITKGILVDLTAYANGLYFVRMVYNNITICTKTIFKQ